jgi:hypothetical protein
MNHLRHGRDAAFPAVSYRHGFGDLPAVTDATRAAQALGGKMDGIFSKKLATTRIFSCIAVR